MPIHQLISSSFLFVGKNTDKGNIFCRGPTIDSIYLFSAMLKYNTSNPQPIGFRGNLLVKRPKFFYCTYSLGITETS